MAALAVASFGAAQTAKLLPFPALCKDIERALVTLASNPAGIACAQRTVTPLARGGCLLLMAAADETLAVTKVVTVHPQNSVAGNGLPAVKSDVMVCEATTGRRLLQLDGDAVTACRTPAVSVVAALRSRPHLATAKNVKLLVVGDGAQARSHGEAFKAVLSVGEVRMVSRVSGATGTAMFGDLTAGDLAWADVIVTATIASSPVFSGAASLGIRNDAIVCAIGAFTPTMCELPRELVKRARLVADRLDSVRVEGGDFIQAEVDFTRDVTDLSACGPLPLDRPVVFKSVGTAVWDLAAAHCAWKHALQLSGAKGNTKSNL